MHKNSFKSHASSWLPRQNKCPPGNLTRHHVRCHFHPLRDDKPPSRSAALCCMCSPAPARPCSLLLTPVNFSTGSSSGSVLCSFKRHGKLGGNGALPMVQHLPRASNQESAISFPPTYYSVQNYLHYYVSLKSRLGAALAYVSLRTNPTELQLRIAS